jgi:L-threonylcarbamoyladenylate synthase
MTVLAFRTPVEIGVAIPTAVEHLGRGGLVAYPTETVYGLGSRPRAAELAALERLKGRREGKPFLLLVANRAMAERFGLVLNAAARALSDRFWPGPLTLVLPGGEGRLPDRLRGAEGGIAVRWTSHAAVARLVASSGAPLTSTSANRTGGPTAPGAAAIVDLFRTAVTAGDLLVLDGGVLGNQPPSTVVDCTTAQPRLIREGALPRDELRRAVGSLAP